MFAKSHNINHYWSFDTMKNKFIASILGSFVALFATSGHAGTTPCVPAPPHTTCVAVTFYSDKIPQPFAYVYSQRAAEGEAPTLFGVTLSTAFPPVPKYEPIAVFDVVTGLWTYSYHGIEGTSPFYAVLPATLPGPRPPKN